MDKKKTYSDSSPAFATFKRETDSNQTGPQPTEYPDISGLYTLSISEKRKQSTERKRDSDRQTDIQRQTDRDG